MGPAGAGGFAFHDPAWLALALAIPAVAWLRQRRAQMVWVVPFASAWSGRAPVPRSRWPELLLGLGLLLLLLALARPQRVEERRLVHREGYDLVLAVDLSGSMLAEDQERDGKRVNRLQALKPILEAFSARREGDRIGVVTFGGRAYTLAPLTFDHEWLRRQIARLRVGLVEDGTALGDALGLAVARLGQPGQEEAGRRKGGFIILLTDGASNTGQIAPLDAARLAAARGIPVYTIGSGRSGLVPMPVFDGAGRKVGYRRVQSDLDEETLEAIAQQTGARYFRAADPDTVEAAFAAIDAERKIEFEARSDVRAREYFAWAAAPGLLLALAGFWLARAGGAASAARGGEAAA
jgi:Ca-activated chloride channel family protein